MEYARRRPKNSRGQQRLLPLILPFLEVPQDREAVSPLNYFSGKDALVPIAVFRSGFDRDAVFLGVKGGAPNAPHGHMDGGSFVLEADGVRWAQDLGMENYHKIESRGMNLWSNARNSDRWRIFRIGFQSHNIPVIDDQPPRFFFTVSFFPPERNSRVFSPEASVAVHNCQHIRAFGSKPLRESVTLRERSGRSSSLRITFFALSLYKEVKSRTHRSG